MNVAVLVLQHCVRMRLTPARGSAKHVAGSVGTNTIGDRVNHGGVGIVVDKRKFRDWFSRRLSRIAAVPEIASK